MSRPFVSVVTPTYNRRRFLPILIHQFNMQTYPANRRELIILDDSPTSNEDLIPKNSNIRYVYQSEKMNLGEKRNKLNEKMSKFDKILNSDKLVTKALLKILKVDKNKKFNELKNRVEWS